MWGIFLESVVVFKNYMGFHERGLLGFLYLAILLYLWIAEKDKLKRILFVYVPSFLLFCFFCPVFRMIFVALFDDADTYYRLLWLLQMSMVSTYGMVRIVGRHRRGGLVLMCAVVILCGKYVYGSSYITKAENAYHLPSEVIELVDEIAPGEGESWINVLFPADCIYYVRQYKTNIHMPYGREMLIAKWDYSNDMYSAMEECEVIDTPSFVELTRANYCLYVVLKKDRKLKEPLTDYKYEEYGRVGDYVIYRDMTL